MVDFEKKNFGNFTNPISSIGKQGLNSSTCWPNGSDFSDMRKANTDLVYVSCNKNYRMNL